MSYTRKYKPGKTITSLDELAEQEFVYIYEKIYHCGWVMSLQFRFVKIQMEAGHIRYAERVICDG